MPLFGDVHARNFKTTANLIETLLKQIGEDVKESRLDEDEAGSREWVFSRQTAVVYIRLTRTDDGNYLNICCPIMKMPADKLLPFYRRLLELNNEKLIGAAFGLKDDLVVIAVDRFTTDIDLSEIESMVTAVTMYANEYGDKLVEEFGGTKYLDTAD